jgi:hypothetical protein
MLTDGPGVLKVVDIGGTDDEPEGKVSFLVGRVFLTVSSFADAFELDLASFDCLLSSNNRCRSVSHD